MAEQFFYTFLIIFAFSCLGRITWKEEDGFIRTHYTFTAYLAISFFGIPISAIAWIWGF